MLAYEPIWAIGTGLTATPEQAQEAVAFVRALVEGIDKSAGQAVRILYGGSLKPDNAEELLGLPDVDGALVGGASLDPESVRRVSSRSPAGSSPPHGDDRRRLRSAMPANDQLTALDATFLELEQADDSAADAHRRSAFVRRRSPAAGRRQSPKVREHLEQRLDLLPRYRQKLSAPRTGGLSWPSWEADQRFEIEAHVRHATLPSPGEEGEFLEWISDFYSHRLDRSRPLWEIVLLDGLADGRWALVTKTHHCLVDGVGSVDLVGLLLDAEPAPPRRLRAPLRARVGLRRRLARMALSIYPRR